MTPALVTLERGAGEGFRLTAEHRLAAPLDHVFAFFSEPGNLERITPPWLRFRIEEAPPSLQTGALIDYRLRLHGIPLGWRTEITAWEPPHRFVDEQVRGPFRRWVHEHTFASEGGSTVVRDVVQYTMLLAPIAQRIVVGRDLRAIFAYRHRMVAALLGDTGLTPP